MRTRVKKIREENPFCVFNFVSPDIIPGPGSVEWSVSSFSTKLPRELLRTVSTLRITRALEKQSTRAGETLAPGALVSKICLVFLKIPELLFRV